MNEAGLALRDRLVAAIRSVDRTERHFAIEGLAAASKDASATLRISLEPFATEPQLVQSTPTTLTAETSVPGTIEAMKSRARSPAAAAQLCKLVRARIGGELGAWVANPVAFVVAPDVGRAAWISGCKSCGASGSVACSSCSGGGRSSCTSCGGSGSVEGPSKSCSSCEGHGSPVCRTCNGTNRAPIYDGVRIADWGPCGCNGGRSGFCGACQGSGNGPRTQERCSGCGGSGKVSCSTCGANGKLRCTPCAGKGQLLREVTVGVRAIPRLASFRLKDGERFTAFPIDGMAIVSDPRFGLKIAQITEKGLDVDVELQGVAAFAKASLSVGGKVHAVYATGSAAQSIRMPPALDASMINLIDAATRDGIGAPAWEAALGRSAALRAMYEKASANTPTRHVMAPFMSEAPAKLLARKVASHLDDLVKRIVAAGVGSAVWQETIDAWPQVKTLVRDASTKAHNTVAMLEIPAPTRTSLVNAVQGHLSALSGKLLRRGIAAHAVAVAVITLLCLMQVRGGGGAALLRGLLIGAGAVGSWALIMWLTARSAEAAIKTLRFNWTSAPSAWRIPLTLTALGLAIMGILVSSFLAR